jgi:hypothetical protein
MKWREITVVSALLSAAVLYMAIGCGKQGEGLPSEVLESLTQEQIDQLEEHGFTIHEGSEPPNVEGAYLTNAELCTYSYDGYTGWTTYPYYYNYTGQNNETLTVAYNCPRAGDSAAGDPGYIAGSGTSFSIFVISKGTTNSKYGSHTISYTLVTIYSGAVDTDGIHDFEDAFICTHKENDIYNEFMDVNGDRIFKEQDTLAERLASWPFHASDFRPLSDCGAPLKAQDI